MTQLEHRGRQSCTALAYIFALICFAFLVWRAALPNNRERMGMAFRKVETDGTAYYLPKSTFNYENAVTLTTARNFARDGFLRTHFLPNRRGHPLVSLYDQTGTICEPVEPRTRTVTYFNHFGQKRDAISLNNDCIYTHYPPLADWVFGALMTLGFERIIYFKLFAILLNCSMLLAIYFWLRREVRAPIAPIAMIFAGTLPDFLEWADVLYYHCMQYLLLVAGILTWSRWLEQRRRRWYGATWLLYFGESLASYQLTVAFGILLAGLLILDQSRVSLWRTARDLALQALAPVSAFALQLVLSFSFFGADRVRRNLGATLQARVNEEMPGGFQQLFEHANQLLPWYCVVGAVLLLVIVRAVRGVPLGRPLGLLVLYWVAGTSFILAFPGTTSWHGWMMHRHLMPFVVLLMAYAADAVWLSWELWRAPHCARSLGAQAASYVGAVCVALGAIGLAMVGWRHLGHIRGEVAFNLARNQRSDSGNLVLRSLDVIHWTEGVPRIHGVPHLPIGGIRVSEPPGWLTDFRMLGPATSHYEIWWLEPVEVKTARILVDQAQAKSVMEHCMISFYDGEDFRRVWNDSLPAVEDFIPEAGEPPPLVPYSWIRFRSPTAVSSRALRLTCGGFDTIALRQVEAFSDDPDVRAETTSNIVASLWLGSDLTGEPR